MDVCLSTPSTPEAYPTDSDALTAYPTDVWFHVFEHLSEKELAAIRTTSKYGKELVDFYFIPEAYLENAIDQEKQLSIKFHMDNLDDKDICMNRYLEVSANKGRADLCRVFLSKGASNIKNAFNECLVGTGSVEIANLLIKEQSKDWNIEGDNVETIVLQRHIISELLVDYTHYISHSKNWFGITQFYELHGVEEWVWALEGSFDVDNIEAAKYYMDKISESEDVIGDLEVNRFDAGNVQSEDMLHEVVSWMNRLGIFTKEFVLGSFAQWILHVFHNEFIADRNVFWKFESLGGNVADAFWLANDIANTGWNLNIDDWKNICFRILALENNGSPKIFIKREMKEGLRDSPFYDELVKIIEQ